MLFCDVDAKHDKADVEKICEEQAELDKQQQEQLAVLLHKCEALFDGQLGRWHGQEVKLELQEGAKHCHARAYNTPLTMPHTDIESRGGTPRQNQCSEEGEPLRMGCTCLHHS